MRCKEKGWGGMAIKVVDKPETSLIIDFMHKI